VRRACDDARAGRPAAHPFLNVHLQSAVDDSVAPPGRHTLSIFASTSPTGWAEGTWDARRDAIADEVRAALGPTRRTSPAPCSPGRCWPRPTSRPGSA
jgi:phytoene dehydrogenase-like protein